MVFKTVSRLDEVRFPCIGDFVKRLNRNEATFYGILWLHARHTRAARRLPDPPGACAVKMQVTAKRGPGGDPAGMDAGRLAAEAWRLSLQVGPRRAK